MKKILTVFVAAFALASPLSAVAQMYYSYPTYGMGMQGAMYVAQCANLPTDLSQGSRGTDVLSLQRFLVSQNWGTASMLTGYFGPITEHALRNFQASRGLAQTGTANAATRAVIMQESCGYSGGYGGGMWDMGRHMNWQGYQYGYQYPYSYQYPYYQYNYPYGYQYQYGNWQYPYYQNPAPSISGVTGPTTLQAGSSGTWTLNLNLPSDQYVSTTVEWGDEYLYSYGYSATPSSYAQGTRSFSHTYYQRGNYTIRFTVRDSQGRESRSTATVNVY